jgi:hypothetical protein
MKKIAILLSFIALSVSSCTDDITGLNQDTKNPVTTKSEFLFTNAQKALSDQMVSTSVNLNVYRLFVQQWTETTYLDESQYNLATRTIPDNHFRILYRDVLRDLLEAKTMLDAETPATAEATAVLNNKKALVDILSVYAYHVLVDTFGDIPYTEALNIEGFTTPKYDDAQTIYKDLITRLTADVAKLDASAASFNTADLYYSGDAAQWVKFANSLRLKLAVNMNDVDPSYSAAQITAAIAGGVITANADNAVIHYSSSEASNYNPIYNDLVASNRNDFVPGKTIVDAMNTLNDPRRPSYFTFKPGTTDYVGGIIGETNSYASYSHVADPIKAKDFVGTIISATEVQFLLAEAAARGVSAAGNAESRYNAAISASFEEWGAGDANAYLGQANVKYNAANWKKSIGEQAWIALYNRGFEAWTSYRRLDFPVLSAPPLTYNDVKEVPKRYSYPAFEETLNGANVQAASTKIGGNTLITKLFWDKH